MEVTVTLDNGFEKELSVIVPWEAVREDYSRVLKRYAQLPLRGFRPGKSPMGLVESSFGPQINEDLLAAVSARLCRKALQQCGLVAGTHIEVSDSVVLKDEYLRMKAAFIVMPEFDLPDYTRLGLQSSNPVEIQDEISLKLLGSTDISLHPCFVENEMKYSDPGPDEAEDRVNAESRVKLMLILKKIATQDGIEIDEHDIETRMGEVASENGVLPDELRRFLVENNGLYRFTDSLLAEATLAYIAEIQIETFIHLNE